MHINIRTDLHLSCLILFSLLSLFLTPKALSDVESEDMVQEERARKAAVRKSRMESDLDAENADLQEKKGVRGKLLRYVHFDKAQQCSSEGVLL